MPLAIRLAGFAQLRENCEDFLLRVQTRRPLIFAIYATLFLFVFVSPPAATASPASSNATTSAAVGGTTMSLSISSPSFSSGGDIPKKFTCDGADVSPQLIWTEPPSGTKSLALLVDDPDAPAGNWNHWTLWNLPANTRGLPEGFSKTPNLTNGTEQGKNDFRKTGYNGPCPPPGKPHRYFFNLFALDVKLDLKPGASKRELEDAMKGHILAQAEWMGRYGR
jgi:Raf kinase inhibitor-like YbhB/YbcL family protein